jgi:ribosome biogenesis protein SSF1/2
MMLPNTAASLRESKRNTLKDFLAVAGPLGVSHFLILTATEKSTYIRVAKTPRVRDKGGEGLRRGWG